MWSQTSREPAFSRVTAAWIPSLILPDLLTLLALFGGSAAATDFSQIFDPGAAAAAVDPGALSAELSALMSELVGLSCIVLTTRSAVAAVGSLWSYRLSSGAFARPRHIPDIQLNMRLHRVRS